MSSGPMRPSRDRRHEYPADLAAFVAHKWLQSPDNGPLPLHVDELARLLSTCYQASLMSEEARPIAFRLLFTDPADLNPFDGPPDGLQPLAFAKPRPCDENELRRLSPACEFDRSLVGVHVDGAGDLRIWGVVHSGTRWVHAVQGGRQRARPLPLAPVILVRGPGEISVCRGNQLIATLRRGLVAKPAVNVFQSSWLPAYFADSRREVFEVHIASRTGHERDEAWADVDPDFLRVLAQNVVRRFISAARQERHGGTILFVPSDLPGDGVGPYISLNYAFAPEPSRGRFRYLLEGAMRELASAARRAEDASDEPVGWEAYVQSDNRKLSEIDDAVFEIAHLYAALSSVDGALVLDKRFEVLGFGGIISGALPDVDEVDRAVDVEGATCTSEQVSGVGTRHRSVFRLVAARPDVLAIIVSQDGDVRFVRSHAGRVTYWDQLQETTV